jgi:anti-anti-sigma factor
MSQLTCELYGDALVATIVGAIDRRTSPRLQAALIDAIQPAAHAVCDLTDVTSISSTGYRMLLHVYHVISANGGRVALTGASSEIRDTILATGFSEFFVMTRSLDEALEHVCQESIGHASLR